MFRIQLSDRAITVADEKTEHALRLAARAAKAQVPVLIVGESGTGKELVARYIHEKGNWTKGPFVSVNCAAIPDGLLEAELFGFERGAFTGALARRIGKFEQAHLGTLLLDEISEMPLPLQAKLLRALQEGEIDRLGGGKSIKVQAQVVATTNQEPLILVESGTFRQDLYYRLNVVRIDCAPLRGRPKAIETLVETFMNAQCTQWGMPIPQIDSKAMDLLKSYPWPGNIRELQNAVERALLACESGILHPEEFKFLQTEQSTSERIAAQGAEGEIEFSLSKVEQKHILHVLNAMRGNRAAAARKLGISVRTLRNKLKEWAR